MDVPKFLVCNLAAADFFMGIYLGKLVFSMYSGVFYKSYLTNYVTLVSNFQDFWL